ncbi:DUF4440 domain-containing protein [Corynebacterium suedekumii]|nr:DUF4440 domain-containing protein [Corynebacterium suedekumii]
MRGDVDRPQELPAPDFFGIGASGRQWDREAILNLLSHESGVDIQMSHLAGRALTPEIIQVFWVSEQQGRRARRTSLWQQADGRWQQVYHQGTAL